MKPTNVIMVAEELTERHLEICGCTFVKLVIERDRKIIFKLGFLNHDVEVIIEMTMLLFCHFNPDSDDISSIMLRFLFRISYQLATVIAHVMFSLISHLPLSFR